MTNAIRGILFICVLTLLSCTMPSTRIYSLSLPLEEKSVHASAGIPLVIQVDSERYLKQPYIVYRESPYTFKVSRYSKWELSPHKLVRQKFKETLAREGRFKEVRASNITPEGFYPLKLFLSRFERVDIGNDSYGRFDLTVNLFDPSGKEMAGSSLSTEIRLNDRSFEALAEALSTALHEGIQEVREEIFRAVEKYGNR
jgi:uncharacterized lipoprotein YmbA